MQQQKLDIPVEGVKDHANEWTSYQQLQNSKE